MNESEETVYFSELCRLCLLKPGIFNVFTNKDLMHDIYVITGVKVFSFNNLPQAICTECSEIINNAKSLRDIANKNDMHMRTLTCDSFQPIKQIKEEKAFTECNSHDLDLSEHNEIESQEQHCNNYAIKIEDTTFHKESYASSEEASEIPQAVRSAFFSNSDSVVTEAPSTHPSPLHLKNNIVVPQVTVRKDLLSPSMNQIEPTSHTQTTPEPAQLPTVKCKRTPEQSDLVYRCKICAKDFETRRKFYFHNRGHNKTIECFMDGCRKKFACNNDLEKHVRTHTGEKPYQCEICCRRFAQRVTLKHHREAVHSSTCKVIIGT